MRRPLSHQKHTPGNFSGRPVLLLGTHLPAVKVFVCRTQNPCTPYREQGSSNTLGARPHPGAISQQHLPSAGVSVSHSSAAVAPPGNSWPSGAFKFLKRGNDLTEAAEESTEAAGTLPSLPPHFRGGSTIILLPLPP